MGRFISFVTFICWLITLLLSPLSTIGDANSLASTNNDLQEPGEMVVRTQTNLVTIYANVKDSAGHNIGGLKQQEFSIYDNNVEQQIMHFDQVDQPISLGIIFDISISMKNRLARCRSTLEQFLQTRVKHDQFYLLTFNSTVDLARDFTYSAESIVSAISQYHAEGFTALNDAVYLGLIKAKLGRHRKRALLLLTDGDDNVSKIKHRELLYALSESDVQIYSIGVVEDHGLSKRGRQLLIDLAEISGGLTYFPRNHHELITAMEKISIDLRSQYCLGFSPSMNRTNSWHNLKIKLRNSATSLAVRARSGYYY